jgi:hypothetical protein
MFLAPTRHQTTPVVAWSAAGELESNGLAVIESGPVELLVSFVPYVYTLDANDGSVENWSTYCTVTSYGATELEENPNGCEVPVATV